MLWLRVATAELTAVRRTGQLLTRETADRMEHASIRTSRAGIATTAAVVNVVESGTDAVTALPGVGAGVATRAAVRPVCRCIDILPVTALLAVWTRLAASTAVVVVVLQIDTGAVATVAQ